MIASSWKSFETQIPLDRPVYGIGDMVCQGWETTGGGKYVFRYKQVEWDND